MKTREQRIQRALGIAEERAYRAFREWFETFDAGELNRTELFDNSWGNAAEDDVPMKDKLRCAINTAEDYVDQGVSSY